MKIQGDLNKTAIIGNLLSTHPSERHEDWEKEFLINLAGASFRCGDPQVRLPF